MPKNEKSETVIIHRFELNENTAWVLGVVGFFGVLSCATVGKAAMENFPQIIQQLNILLGK